MATTEAEDPVGCFSQANAMANGDVQRRDVLPCAQYEPYHLSLIDELYGSAALRWRKCGFTAEPAFGDADRWDTGQQAEMTGDAEAARVGEAVAVDQNQFRLSSQLPECLRQQRCLAEGEQAGNVRERHGRLDHVRLGQIEGRIGEHDDGCARLCWPSVGPLDKRNVGGSHQADVPRVAFGDDLRRQLGLERHRFARRQVPTVKVTEDHGLLRACEMSGARFTVL